MTHRMHILVDLDGTLIDPKPGILGSIRYALEALGAPVPPVGEMAWAIGPPLRDTFPLLLGDALRTEEAIALYRDNFRNGAMFEALPRPCVQSAPEVSASTGAERLVALRKTFHK